MALSDNQVQHRCLYAAGSSQCRYLEQDRSNWRVFHCLKKLAGRKRDADRAVRKYLAECKQKKRDPHSGWTPIGDGGNCQGYAYLPTVKQGYDVKTP